jgi:hypothetical protein
MTRKITVCSMAVFAIALIGMIASPAFAEKPTQTIVPVDVNLTDYGSGSTFDVEKVECKISTKGSETTVNWCKATLMQNKVTFETCLADPETCFVAFFDVLNAIFIAGADYDMVLVEWEVEQLTDTIDTILETDHPGIVIPEDYEEKSVELEFSINNDGGTETSQTKVVVGIEY